MNRASPAKNCSETSLVLVDDQHERELGDESVSWEDRTSASFRYSNSRIRSVVR